MCGCVLIVQYIETKGRMDIDNNVNREKEEQEEARAMTEKKGIFFRRQMFQGFSFTCSILIFRISECLMTSFYNRINW